MRENEETLEDFMAEEPTIRCGEGGCYSCNLAFHRVCDPNPHDVEPQRAIWEGDTLPSLPVLVWDELGGES